MSDHVAITTLRRPSRLLFPGTNPNLGTTSPSNIAVSTTPPTSSNNSGIVAGPTNYLRIMPLLESGASSPAIRVTGWSFVQGLDKWVPQMLAEASISLSTAGTSISVNTTNLLPSFAFGQTAGDFKSFAVSSGSDVASAWMVVDTCGFDLVQIDLWHSTGTKKCNAIIGEF